MSNPDAVEDVPDVDVVQETSEEQLLDTDVDWEKLKATLVFLLPGLTLFGIFAVAPMAYSAVGSFFAWDGFDIGAFVGLQQWEATLTDPNVVNWDNMAALQYPMGALPQNLIWMLVHVPLSTVLGLVLALLFADLRGRRILRSMVFLAFTTPTIVIGLVLLFVYDPNAGIYNALLEWLFQTGPLSGILSGAFAFAAQYDHLIPVLTIAVPQPENWLQDKQIAIYALIAGSVWVQTGFSMLLYSSALAGIDPSLLESARIDGAGPFRRFKDIIWPLVKPVTAVVVIMGMIWVLRIFAIVYAAGGPSGGPQGAYSVLGIEVFAAAFQIPIEYGKAMVVALIELLLAMPMAAYIARME